mmetsp:Transcript_6712/g.28591  ORF Transcript_6712/g.28591 Transcript_6712/m.28591 type:complete len:291 (+) Transcript_6712:725-1597(+)
MIPTASRPSRAATLARAVRGSAEAHGTFPAPCTTPCLSPAEPSPARQLCTRSATFSLLLSATASTPSAPAATASGASPWTSSATERSGASAPSACRSLALSMGATSSSISSSAKTRSASDRRGSANISVACLMNCCSVGLDARSSSASLTSLRFESISSCVNSRRRGGESGEGVFASFDEVARFASAADASSPPSPPRSARAAISRSVSGSEFSIAQLNRLCMLSSGRASSAPSGSTAAAASPAGGGAESTASPTGRTAPACAATSHPCAHRNSAASANAATRRGRIAES